MDVTQLTDRALRNEAASRIHAAAIMNTSRWADQYHAAVDEVYAECRRRGRPSIYGHAYNDVLVSQGYKREPVPPDPEAPAEPSDTPTNDSSEEAC